MVEEFEVCPLCGKQYRPVLLEVKEGESYTKEDCEHCLWDPLRGTDFLKEFLEHEGNNPSIRVPQFHTLNLKVIPNEALEKNRLKLEKILQDNLHEVNGWWFGTLEEREATCKELITFLKPLCEFYTKRFESSSEQ